MSKRADLEDLQEAQEAEEEQAAAVTETDMTPMTTRPHQMPGNAEEETKYDPGAGHPAAGDDNEPAIEQPEDDDDEEEDTEDDDMPDFMTESVLTPIVCHACTRKFAVNQVKLGLRCICGSDDLDLDEKTAIRPFDGGSPMFTGDPNDVLRTEYTFEGVEHNFLPEGCQYQFQAGHDASNCIRAFKAWKLDNGMLIPDYLNEMVPGDPRQGSKTALDVEAPNAEIPAPGGAVDDDPMPPVVEPTSSDEPRADELPDNQQFAEPFSDEDAVEAKMALMAREVFKSQRVSPKQALLIAQKVLASYPLVAASRSIEIQISGGGPSTLARELAKDIINIPSGDSWQFVINGQSTFTVWYDEQGAIGDSGQPVGGDVTGEYEVLEGPLIGGSVILRQHVSPHGSSGYGNPQAKVYAAERVAEAIANRAVGI